MNNSEKRQESKNQGERGCDGGPIWEMSTWKEGKADVKEGVMKFLRKSTIFFVGVSAAVAKSLFFLRPVSQKIQFILDDPVLNALCSIRTAKLNLLRCNISKGLQD